MGGMLASVINCGGWSWVDIGLLAQRGGSFLCVGIVVFVVLMAVFRGRSGRVCPHCHEVNRPPAVFCAQCGKKLPLN